jgi:uncharacterized membrane protein
MNQRCNAMMKLSLFGALGSVILCSAQCRAESFTFQSFDFPGATSTGATGINDSGQIVGDYFLPSTGVHGFLKDGANFVSIDYPGALNTLVSGINDSGQIVGGYQTMLGSGHGFLSARDMGFSRMERISSRSTIPAPSVWVRPSTGSTIGVRSSEVSKIVVEIYVIFFMMA